MLGGWDDKQEKRERRTVQKKAEAPLLRDVAVATAALAIASSVTREAFLLVLRRFLLMTAIILRISAPNFVVDSGVGVPICSAFCSACGCGYQQQNKVRCLFSTFGGYPLTTKPLYKTWSMNKIAPIILLLLSSYI